MDPKRTDREIMARSSQLLHLGKSEGLRLVNSMTSLTSTARASLPTLEQCNKTINSAFFSSKGNAESSSEADKPPSSMQTMKKVAIGGAAGVAVVTVGIPLALGAVGFGTGGIAAGSLAAKAMSVVYTTNVGMGGLAVAQSVGAAGVGLSTSAVGGLVGGYLGKNWGNKEADNGPEKSKSKL